MLLTVNIKSKELSLPVKPDIFRLENPNNFIRETAKTSVAKSSIKIEGTSEFRNTRKTTTPRNVTCCFLPVKKNLP